ncbi:MAG: hypothetical protein K6U74_20295 [Firmicutes bacterium]|nr:hypothetical protein [Bacillota bacterium]
MPLTTGTATEKSIPGGGGSVDTVDEAPVVNSVTFVVDGRSVPVSGSNNNFNVNLTGYPDNARFTSLTINASSDADKARVSLMGIEREITFHQGVAAVSVDELIGQPGITLGGLKTILELIGTNEISVTVTDKTDHSSEVTVTINV